MKILRLSLCLLASLALIAGCSKKSEDVSMGLPPDAPLPDRLEAASKITNTEDRDNALSRIALDSANARQADIAKKAIEKLSTQQSRDDVAAGVAKSFARLGDADGAGQLASMISSPELKERTLEAIAGMGR